MSTIECSATAVRAGPHAQVAGRVYPCSCPRTIRTYRRGEALAPMAAQPAMVINGSCELPNGNGLPRLRLHRNLVADHWSAMSRWEVQAMPSWMPAYRSLRHVLRRSAGSAIKPTWAPPAIAGSVLPPEEHETDPLFEEALGHIQKREWGRAQRALEQYVRGDSLREATQYLAEVRAVRRCLRQIEKWPRDASRHLELGRLCFGLELGDVALEALSRAVALKPDLAVAYHLLALEYLYRGNKAAARKECERAHALDVSLPSFSELEGQMQRIESAAS